jgi:hypothetical protein
MTPSLLCNLVIYCKWVNVGLTGKLNWRITTPDGGFFTRSTVQNFVQDSQQPGVLYNHGNEFLHYQDDWSLLHSFQESWQLVFFSSMASKISFT